MTSTSVHNAIDSSQWNASFTASLLYQSSHMSFPSNPVHHSLQLPQARSQHPAIIPPVNDNTIYKPLMDILQYISTTSTLIMLFSTLLLIPLLGFASAAPASTPSIERREECKPLKACHPICERQRRALAECRCMYLGCGMGGRDYNEKVARYDECCARQNVRREVESHA
ncbi:hypothetical protein BKA63DRAFT_492404 [Paraphoma chrysanthemicola]|nr:hypothetical protein BKA63DRAFT_492404 [Paraphoma chrysanthemicola]